jgi:hypothetical protein
MHLHLIISLSVSISKELTSGIKLRHFTYSVVEVLGSFR